MRAAELVASSHKRTRQKKPRLGREESDPIGDAERSPTTLGPSIRSGAVALPHEAAAKISIEFTV